MRRLIEMLLFLTAVFIACDKEQEEIYRTPPPVIDENPSEIADTTTVTETDTAANETPPEEVEYNDSYAYGKVGELPYRYLLPRDYDPAKVYPLLIFLHGIGESGTDNERQLTWGAEIFQRDSIRTRYPAIVVFPQCKRDVYWFERWGMYHLKMMLDSLNGNYEIDPTRTYIAGLSMGAYGTYAMVAEHPDVFAAAIAISGSGDTKKSASMKKPSWWIFAGEKDETVPSGKSKSMANALKKHGAKVRLTIYPTAGHKESWEYAFNEPDFCYWMFTKSRR